MLMLSSFGHSRRDVTHGFVDIGVGDGEPDEGDDVHEEDVHPGNVNPDVQRVLAQLRGRHHSPVLTQLLYHGCRVGNFAKSRHVV